MTAPRHNAGFTLMELLIAIAVFAVMAAMAYGGLASVLQTREAVSGALDRSKTLQLAIWRLRRDIEQIVDRPIRDRLGDRRVALRGSPTSGIVLTRNGWRNPLAERRSHLQRVAYHLDDDGNLIRGYWRVLDRAPDSPPVKSTLLAHVTQIEWRFLDAQRRWQATWPAGAGPSIGGLGGASNAGIGGLGGAASGAAGGASSRRFRPPLAVELRLTTRTWGKLRLLFMVPGARQ